MVNSLVSSYDALSLEYYDPSLHPTCADFRDLSKNYIEKHLRELARDEARILEVGSGKSVTAELLCDFAGGLSSLVLTDASETMLRYSQKWASKGAELRVLDATKLKESDLYADIIVASLGDPYNTFEFWAGVCATLKPEGFVIFTMPSFDWASDFRIGSVGFDVAEFASPSLGKVLLPSCVLSLKEQVDQIHKAGLLVKNFSSIGWEDASKNARSAKLRNSKFYKHSLIWGFVATPI